MTLSTNELSQAAEKALSTIRNLRKLTQESGTVTTRAQNDILRALKSADIATVANALAAQ